MARTFGCPRPATCWGRAVQPGPPVLQWAWKRQWGDFTPQECNLGHKHWKIAPEAVPLNWVPSCSWPTVGLNYKNPPEIRLKNLGNWHRIRAKNSLTIFYMNRIHWKRKLCKSAENCSKLFLEPPVNIFSGGFYSFETSVQQQQGRLFTAQKHKMSSSQRLFSSPMPDHAEKGH